ncbi:MAG: hypothetical protein ACPG5B_05770 [Chitinophagales bacterium]
MFITTAVLSIIVMGLVFAGIGIRMLLVKGGEFRGTCAQNNPYLKKEIGNCTVCGKTPEEACKGEKLMAT